MALSDTTRPPDGHVESHVLDEPASVKVAGGSGRADLIPQAHGGALSPGGKKKGSVNKMTAEVKQALAYAFEGIGGAERLKCWAEDHPAEFYKLWAKLLPHEVSGPDGGAIVVHGELRWGGVVIPL